MMRASNHDTLSAFSAENKCCFDHAHDGEPSCMPEHVPWNCFLGHLLKFANDRGATIHSVLFRGISHHQCKSDIARTKSNSIGLPLLRQRLSRRMYPT